MKVVFLGVLMYAIVVNAEPIVINKAAQVRADAIRTTWTNLVVTALATHDFAESVASKCQSESFWEGLGLKTQFNPASGKAIGRLADLTEPKTREECGKFFSICKGAYSVKKSFSKNAKVKEKYNGQNTGHTTGAAAYADSDELATFDKFLAAYESFLKVRCDVRNVRDFRFMSGDYEVK